MMAPVLEQPVAARAAAGVARVADAAWGAEAAAIRGAAVAASTRSHCSASNASNGGSVLSERPFSSLFESSPAATGAAAGRVLAANAADATWFQH